MTHFTMKLVYFLFLTTWAFSVNARSTITLQSTEQQNTLIELYTSEGCSSCPHADQWLSELQTDSGLWQEIVPIAFHVDYWDYIGWKDNLVLPGNTKRQNQYQAEHKINVVYTPGFVINGQEWQGWFKQRTLPPRNRQNVGILTAEIHGDTIDIRFSGKAQDLDYHLVMLGFDIQSQINAGENEGRSLNHDFVALSHDIANSDNNQVSINLPDSHRFKKGRKALAVWINASDSQAPIQSVGGWLPE